MSADHDPKVSFATTDTKVSQVTVQPVPTEYMWVKQLSALGEVSPTTMADTTVSTSQGRSTLVSNIPVVLDTMSPAVTTSTASAGPTVSLTTTVPAVTTLQWLCPRHLPLFRWWQILQRILLPQSMRKSTRI